MTHQKAADAMARFTTARIIAAVVACLLCINATQGARAEPLHLRYGQAYSAARSIFSLPVAIADREGFFAREGLKVELLQPIPGGADNQITALHNDSVDITHVATPFLIRAALGGSDAVAIAAEFNNPIYSIIAKPEIESLAGLKGKVMALADEYGTITLSTRKLMALHGVQRGEFGARVIEGTSGRWACLRRGDCDAVVLGQPQDLVAIEQGFRLLGSTTEAVPELLYTVTAARRSWAEANKEAMVRYVRALAASFKFIRDGANRDRVVRTVMQSTSSSEKIAQQTLALFFEPERGVLPKQGEIDLAGLAQVIGMLGEAGGELTTVSFRKSRARPSGCCSTHTRYNSRSPLWVFGYFHFSCLRLLHAIGSCGSQRPLVQ
jgi:ABC-type nitrate/sulfonate/bicarbonate transport system substrate-binding protein